MNIVLASKSPRRIEMMNKNGFDPVIMPSEIEENEPHFSGMTETPMFLALRKAQDVEERIDSGNPYVIAADTVVYSGRIIGKPKDKADALDILMNLSGRTHYVVTGVAILKAGTTLRTCFAVVTAVDFMDYSPQDIADYLDTDEPYDKAGAYAIQGYFKKYIREFRGSYDNVVGFPWDEILKKLEEMNG